MLPETTENPFDPCGPPSIIITVPACRRRFTITYISAPRPTTTTANTANTMPTTSATVFDEPELLDPSATLDTPIPSKVSTIWSNRDIHSGNEEFNWVTNESRNDEFRNRSAVPSRSSVFIMSPSDEIKEGGSAGSSPVLVKYSQRDVTLMERSPSASNA